MKVQPQKYDIIETIVELVERSMPDLEGRLEAQAEALQENQCNDPEIGQWIDAYDVKYLLSALALKDEDFTPMFPAMSHIPFSDRKRFISTIERHFDKCTHCSLKRGYDMEIDEKIKKVCGENREDLLEIMDSDIDLQNIKEKVFSRCATQASE